MITAKRLARRVSLFLIVAAFSVAIATPSASAHAVAPRTVPPTHNATVPQTLSASSSCYIWNTKQVTYAVAWLNYAGTTYVLDWTIYIYGLYSNSSYCGYASETECLTVPGNWGFTGVDINNEWYYSTDNIHYSLVGAKYTTYHPGPNQTVCSPSGTFAVPRNDYVGAEAYAIDPVGDYSTDEFTHYGPMN